MSRFSMVSGLFASCSFLLLGACSDPAALRTADVNLADPTLRALNGTWSYVSMFDADATRSDAELAATSPDLGEPFAGYELDLVRGAGTAEKRTYVDDAFGSAYCKSWYDVALSVDAAGNWSLREGLVRESSYGESGSNDLCNYSANERLWDSSDDLPLVRVSVVGERLVVVSPSNARGRVYVHVFEHIGR